MASFGVDDKWHNRGTHDMPTKSMIVGLIGSAFGLGYTDELKWEMARLIQMAVRKNRNPGRYTDFQIVGGPLKKADGGIEKGNKVREKDYLTGVSYTIAITSEDEELLDQIRDAILDPCHLLYFGRRVCVPEQEIIPFVTDQYSSLLEALECAECDEVYMPLNEDGTASCVVEYDDPLGMLYLNDNPIGYKQYCVRSVSRGVVNVMVPQREPVKRVMFENKNRKRFEAEAPIAAQAEIAMPEHYKAPCGLERYVYKPKPIQFNSGNDSDGECVYISTFAVDLDNPNTALLQRDKNELHRDIQTMFGCDRKTSSSLFALYESNKNLFLEVLSKKKPSCYMEPFDLISVERIDNVFKKNDILPFEIICNPTKQNEGRRTALTNEDDILAWLGRKADMSGFDLSYAYVYQKKNEYVHRQGKQFKFFTANLRGKLMIKDPEQFWKAFVSGIGRELTYGCGMMRIQNLHGTTLEIAS